MPTTNKSNFYVDTATGADINGGSNAGATKETYDDVSIDTDEGGSIYLIDNSASTGSPADWGTTAVDDFICYDTASAVEFARVTALSVGADDNIIRVDASFQGNLTNANVNVNVGGAWATIDFPLNMVVGGWANAAGDPITIWVKGGAYPELATIDNVGTVTSPIALSGYKTNEGDGWDYDWDSNLPTMDGGGSSNYGIRVNSLGTTYWIIEHIRVTDSTGAGFIGDNASNNIRLNHCKADLNDLWGIQGNNAIDIRRCEITGNLGGGIDVDVSCIVTCNDIYSNTGHGLVFISATVVGNQFWDNTGRNISTATTTAIGSYIGYNTIDGGYDNVFGNGARTSSVGIYIDDTSPFPLTIEYNAVHNCDIAFHSDAAGAYVNSFYNLWGNSNSANANWVFGEGDADLSADGNFPGFTNEGGANLQPTASSSLNGAAGPTALPAGLTTTNRATGAAEPATAAGGAGGTRIVGPGTVVG